MNKLVFGSKKATVTTAGAGLIPAAIVLVTFIMQAAGASEELTQAAVTVLTFALTALLSSYNIGQGIADSKR